MAERKRRVFPDTFKREAVERVRTSGMTIIAVAEELGLHETCCGGGSRGSAGARRWLRHGGRLWLFP